jgi:hypothetical protein
MMSEHHRCRAYLYASNLYHYGEVITCVEVPLISEWFVFFVLGFLFFFFCFFGFMVSAVKAKSLLADSVSERACVF